VLPLESVEECLDFRTSDIGSEGLLDLRGSPLPWVRLRTLLGLPDESVARASVVVVKSGDTRLGLVVDTLEGDCQAVIKPLSGGLRRIPGLAGSTILGSGRVALILDAPRLKGLAGAHITRR
jgi:two-component system chemotaxis sensor kinase CheA